MEHNLSEMALLGCAIVVGFYCGSAARKLRLPSLIGFMVLGIFLGPSGRTLFGFQAFSDEMLRHISFITELVLGFVAFNIGSELSMQTLRKLGVGIVSVILAESFGAFIVVLGLLYALTRDLPLSLIFAAMAPASAPAGTVAVIQENRAKGSLTDALYAIVGFDDGLAVIIFGFASSFAKSLLIKETTGSTVSIMSQMVQPLREIGLSIAAGALIGAMFIVLLRRLKTSRDYLIMIFGTTLIATGVALQFHLSLILTNMVVGFMLANMMSGLTVRKIVAPLNEIMPLFFIMFFCLAGAHLELSRLSCLGMAGILYIAGRTAGKLFGARLGAMAGSLEDKVKKNVGLGILSQAGVAIGLSLLVMQDFSRMENPHAVAIGVNVITVISATCIFFEIVGPVCARIALQRAGEINE